VCRNTIRYRARSSSVAKPSLVAVLQSLEFSEEVTCQPAGPCTRALIVWNGMWVSGAGVSAHAIIALGCEGGLF